MKRIAILLLLLPSLGSCTTAHYHYSTAYQPPPADVNYSNRHRYQRGATVIHRHDDAKRLQNTHTHPGYQSRPRHYHYQYKKKYRNHIKRHTRNDDKNSHGHD